MKKGLEFPYPHVIETMDKYYKIHSSSAHKKKDDVHKTYKRTGQKSAQKKKLSILIATFWDYPHMGGLSNYITTLSEGLRQQGHHVDIISPKQFPAGEAEELREAVVPKIKGFFNKRYGSYNSTILKNQRHLYTFERILLKHYDLKQYDVFHAQDLFTANILGRLNEWYGKPLFFTPHGMYTFNRLKFDIFKQGSIEEVYHKAIETKAIEYADHLIILSDSFRQPLLELGAKQEDMTTVLTGIVPPVRRHAKHTSSHGKIVITCVARLGPRKGHNILFDALAKMRSVYKKNIEVLIVGDGEMKEELEKQVESLGLSMVKFLGKRDDVPDLLNKTDIFVLPTLNDSLPLSIIEAMHSGACVISTTVGGIPELVSDSKTGILVQAGDVDALADALKYAIINQQAREKLGRNAKEFAKRQLTRETMTAQIADIYQKYVSVEKVYVS